MATPMHRSSSLGYLIAFPTLLVPFALYNMIAFLLGLDFGTPVWIVPRLSGPGMPIGLGDILVVMGVLLLYVEILKSTRLLIREIMDHVLALILFIAMLGEFVTVPQAATSTFLLLLSLCFVDVIGGFTISIRTAQRDIATETPDRVA
jgi:hypothetical protein